MRRVLITGARDWPPSLQWVIDQALDMVFEVWGSILVVHGKAKGADTMASQWVKSAKAKGFPVDEEGHDYISELGKRGGVVRNQRMVDKGADLCLAFVTPACRGTRDCMDRAEGAQIDTVPFYSEKLVAA